MPRKPSNIYTRLRKQRERADRAGGTIPAHTAAEIRMEEKLFNTELLARVNKAAVTISASLNTCYVMSGLNLRQISRLTGIPTRTLNTIITRDLEGANWKGLSKTSFRHYALLTALFKVAGFGDGLDEARRQYL